MSLELTLILVIAVWLSVISVFLAKIYLYFRNLSKSLDRSNLLEILGKLVKVEKKNSKDIYLLQKEIARIDEENLSDIQKVSLVRFNPFKELGGDHSFVIAMLNGKDCGFLITSLHTREKTRVYMKEITYGKCKLDLSQDEKKALTKAQKSK